MTADEILTMMRDTRATWQDQFGIQGPPTQFEPKPVAGGPTEAFKVTTSEGAKSSPKPSRPIGLDSAYDGSGGDGGTPRSIYGALNGAPALFTLSELAPPVPL